MKKHTLICKMCEIKSRRWLQNRPLKDRELLRIYSLSEELRSLCTKEEKAMEAAFLDVFPNAQPYMKGLVEAKIGKNWSETK